MITGGLAGIVNVEDWVAHAQCSSTDPEAFFPNQGESSRVAKQVCYGCPVRAQCLRYAIENGERFGVWGGYTERERRQFKPGKQTGPRTHCLKGHEYAKVGRTSDGVCAECTRRRRRRYDLRRQLSL